MDLVTQPLEPLAEHVSSSLTLCTLHEGTHLHLREQEILRRGTACPSADARRCLPYLPAALRRAARAPQVPAGEDG